MIDAFNLEALTIRIHPGFLAVPNAIGVKR